MSGKMTKFKDLLVDTPNRYMVNGEVKTIVFSPNAVTQEGTKDKAEYFNEMQKNGLYNVNATRVVEGTVEFYDIVIEGSDIFDVFDTQFIINFNETNTKLNPILRFNGNNYYIRALEGFIDIDVQVGSLQKAYIGFLDSANNKLKLFGNEKKLTFDTVADAQTSTTLVAGDTIQVLGYYSKNDGAGHMRIKNPTGSTYEWEILSTEKGVYNPKWFGAKGDGITNETQYFNELKARYGQGATILLDAGIYLLEEFECNLNIICNSDLVFIKNFSDFKVALRLLQHTPDWDYYNIKGINFISKTTHVGTCIDFTENNSYAGRWKFENCRFNFFDIAINKKFGNIGEIFENCVFIDNNFCIRAKGSTLGIMHTGNLLFNNCEFEQTKKAVVTYIDNTDGTGQCTFNDCIFQYNEGMVLFVNSANLEHFIKPKINSCWFEENATATTVNIDSVDYVPYEIYAIDTPSIICENSYPHKVKLVNSNVSLKDCRIDGSGAIDFNLDSNSSIVAYDVTSDGIIDSDILVKSIVNQKRNNITSNNSMNSYHRNSINYLTNKILGQNFADVDTTMWTGSISRNMTNSVDDGILFKTCKSMLIHTGELLLHPLSFDPSTYNGKYIVWSIACKKMYGDCILLIGYNGSLGNCVLKTGKWITSAGIKKVDFSGSIRLYISEVTENTEIRFADYQILAFDTEPEAITYLNSTSYCDR